MSFLGGRLAGQEGAYFFQESKKAVIRLAQKLPKKTPKTTHDVSKFEEKEADVLPEILKHSLPSKMFQSQHYSEDSNVSVISKSKWAVHVDPNPNHHVSSPDALNPLRAYVSMPQVTFGPKRWELPNAENSTTASTANDLRRDRYPTPLNPEKLKAAAEGLSQIGKAFAIATAAVFGGSTLIFWLIVSKLELRNSDDIRTKGKDLVQPKFIGIKEQLVPLRSWAENVSKKWKVAKYEGNIGEKHIMTKKLGNVLGVKSSG